MQNFPTVTNILADSILANNSTLTTVEYYPETYLRGFEYSHAYIKCYNINAYNKLSATINTSSGNMYTNVSAVFIKK